MLASRFVSLTLLTCRSGVKAFAELAAVADGFVGVHGGEGRACRGVDLNDVSPSYFRAVGPELGGTLEKCKNLCMASPGCTAVQFGATECQLWTQEVEASAPQDDVTCLKLQAFRDVDGIRDRLCQSVDPSLQPAAMAVASFAECQRLCFTSPTCTGVNFNAGSCHVFTSEFASAPSAGSKCWSYQPFIAVDGGQDRECRGSGEDDISESYYVTSNAATLEECKLHCSFNSACKGLTYSGGRCQVWTKAEGIQASKFMSGSVCLRRGALDPLYSPALSAFKPIDGGHNRACRGQDVNDNLDSHYTVSVAWPENSSVEACQDLCVKTYDCKGIEFRSGACEIWTLAGGIKATVPAIGRTCVLYDPFQTLDGFNDRVCRGSNATDSLPSYFDLYSPSVAPSLEACKQLCIQTSGCKGIEYRGWCEVWTRPQGIEAVAVSPGSQCLQYRPFFKVDGGTNRVCRGSGPDDTSSSYYTVHQPVATVDDCKSACIRTEGCKGIEYWDSHCEVWARRGGIQGTAYKQGSVCMRVGPWDSWEDDNAFVALNGAFGACLGTGMSAIEYGLGEVDTLQRCKLQCMSTPSCRGIGFGPNGCSLWLGPGELTANHGTPNATESCYQYKPFRDVDGGSGRDCRGSSSSDHQPSHFLQLQALSLQECQDHCVEHAERDVEGMPCKGLSYNSVSQDCHLWIRPQGIGATVTSENSMCQRYEPFLDLDGGRQRGCSGKHDQDIDPDYFISYGPEQAPNLEACRQLCVATPGCTGHAA